MNKILTLVFLLFAYTTFAQTTTANKPIATKVNKVLVDFASLKTVHTNNVSNDELNQEAALALAIFNFQKQLGNTNMPKATQVVINKLGATWANSATATIPSQANLPIYSLLKAVSNAKAKLPEPLQNSLKNLDSTYLASPVSAVTNTQSLQATSQLVAQLYSNTKQENLLDQFFQQYMYAKAVLGLYASSDLLWFQDESQLAVKTENGRPIFYANANGSAAMALANIIDVSAESNPYFTEFTDTFAEMTIASMNLQNSEGLWPENLSMETSAQNISALGTAYYLTSMAWGVRKGRLDAETFKPIIKNGLKGLDKVLAKKENLNYNLVTAYINLSTELSKK
jgi:hypothetical protein